MNDNGIKGIVGATTSGTGAIVSWLPVVNEAVQIFAGLTAIVAGIFTAIYYYKKSKQL